MNYNHPNQEETMQGCYRAIRSVEGWRMEVVGGWMGH